MEASRADIAIPKPTFLLILDSSRAIEMGKHYFAIGDERVSVHISRFAEMKSVYIITSVYSPEVVKGLVKMLVAHKAPGSAYSLQRVLDCGTVD